MQIHKHPTGKMISPRRHRIGALLLCVLLTAVMGTAAPLTAYAAHAAGEADNDVVKYLYYQEEGSEDYYRYGIKSIYLAPNTYYDTVYDTELSTWTSAWSDPDGRSSDDQAAADEVIELIDQLPATSAVTLADKLQIQTVRAAFNKLSGPQINLVTNQSRLTSAEASLAAKEESVEVPEGMTREEAYARAYAQSVLTKAAALPELSGTSSQEELESAALLALRWRTAFELVPEEIRAELEADEESAAVLGKLFRTEGDAVGYLRAMLPTWYPNDAMNASKEELVAADELAVTIITIYQQMSAEQQAGTNLAGLEFLADNYVYEEEKDTGSAVVHNPGEVHSEVNVSFLDKMIKNYLLKDWAILADKIFATQGESANYVGNSAYRRDFRGSNPGKGLNVANALASPNGSASSKWGDGKGWRYTGLKTATSLSQVRNAMADEVRSGANRKAVTREELLNKSECPLEIDRLEALKSNDSTKAFYSIATYVSRGSSSVHISYESYGLVFYDFDLAVISDNNVDYVTGAEKYLDTEHPLQAAAKDSATGVVYKTNTGNGNNTTTSYTENNSKEDTDVTMSFTNTDSTTLETSFETSESYSYSEMIGSETEIGADACFVNEHIKVEFTAEQAYSTARGNTNSATKETSQTIETSLTIPAQTAIQILQEQNETDITLKYDTPMAITFKVIVFAIGGEGTCTGASTNFTQATAGFENSDFYAVFGCDDAEGGRSAMENLHQRAVMNLNTGGYDQSYGRTSGLYHNNGGRWTESDHINWSSQFSASERQAIKYMTERIPMVPAGTTMKVTSRSLNSKVNGIAPLYLLKNVALGEGVADEYDMTVGDLFYLDSLTVEGLNKNNVAYYGFDPDDGHWELCDAEGNVQETSELAAMADGSALTGQNTVTANAPGEQYLKWVLNDNVVKDKLYNALNEAGFADNDNINTAYVKLNISEKGFDGTVDLQGTYEGYAGEDPVLLTDNGMKVVLKDTTGKEVDRPVTWEAQEMSGVTLEPSGMISFTAPGTYHVRVYTGTQANARKYSDWVEVTALAAKQLESITISDTADPAVLAPIILNDGENTADLAALELDPRDQYGNVWALEDSDITWCVNGTPIDGTVFEAAEAGDYEITAVSGEVVSNALTFTVKEARKLDSLVIESEDLTEKGLGVGEGYQVNLSAGGPVTVTAKDQYGDDFDITKETLEWIADGTHAAVLDNTTLSGNASGESFLQLKIGEVESNVLDFVVFTKPYVKKLYASGENTILEGETFLLKDITLNAKDQNGDNYAMSAKEIDSIIWTLTDEGTIKTTSGASYDEESRSLTVAEGSLQDGKTGSVILSGEFVNTNGKSAVAKATISVKQQPFLVELTLTKKAASAEIATDDTRLCQDFFKVTAKDQYGEDYDLTRKDLTFASDNEEAYSITNPDKKESAALVAGDYLALVKAGTSVSAKITVFSENAREEIITSNAVTLTIPRVRTLESVAFTKAPATLPLESTISMAELGAVCFDELGVAFTEKELNNYNAKITYTIDPKKTDTVLDTAKNILSTGTEFGYISVTANAVNASSTNIVKDSEGNDVISETLIHIGPLLENITAQKTKLDADGGQDAIVITGKGLVNGMVVTLTDESGQVISAETTGSDVKQVATFTIPKNRTSAERKYDVGYQIGKHELVPEKEITITEDFHTLKRTAPAAATCEKAGNIEYWKCTKCGKIYKDEKANTLIAQKDTVIAALGHAWDAGTLVSAAKKNSNGTYVFTCTHDATHKKTANIPLLLLRSKTKKKTLTLTWNAVALADGYEVYFALCGKNDKGGYKLAKDIPAGSALKWKKAKLKKGNFYKAYIKAYRKVNGQKITIAQSYAIHSIIGGYNKKYTNVKSLKLKKTAVTLKTGKTFKIKGVKIKKVKSKKQLPKHEAKLRYATSDKSVATVAKGKITAVAPGSCEIYVITNNGIMAAIHVKVE